MQKIDSTCESDKMEHSTQRDIQLTLNSSEIVKRKVSSSATTENSTRVDDTQVKKMKVGIASNHSEPETISLAKQSKSTTESVQKDSGNDHDNNVDPGLLAGITFPVTKTLKALKCGKYGSQKVGSAAPVYMAAVLEYVTTEVLELAGHAVKNSKLHKKIMDKKGIYSSDHPLTITTDHIEYIFDADEELHHVASNITSLDENSEDENSEDGDAS